MRTSDQTRPETLLAAVNTFFADMVILPPAVLTQKERPFQPPLLASAHRQSCSGTSRPGFLPSWGLCSAHSRFASSNRSRMERLPHASPLTQYKLIICRKIRDPDHSEPLTFICQKTIFLFRIYSLPARCDVLQRKDFQFLRHQPVSATHELLQA